MSKFAAAIAKAAEASPIIYHNEPPIPGRTLLVDGDALCYTCAGNDECAPGQARVNLMDRVNRAKRMSRSEFVRILVTARGSHKGHRYAVARVKPYQGQRDGGRRPKNWEYLRQLVEGGIPEYPTEVTAVAEADDLFGKYSWELGPANVVHHTQDKDMRMVPGYHLMWDSMSMVHVPYGTWEVRHEDKTFGRKWFWLQMLHGDGADNIPGLPEYADGSVYSDKLRRGQLKFMKCGDSTAGKLLAVCENNEQAYEVVRGLYGTYYHDTTDLAMLEQAVLLWMRQRPGEVFDVCKPGNPLENFPKGTGARTAILARIAEAQSCQPG